MKFQSAVMLPVLGKCTDRRFSEISFKGFPYNVITCKPQTSTRNISRLEPPFLMRKKTPCTSHQGLQNIKNYYFFR